MIVALITWSLGAGERAADGRYAPDSLHGRVQQRLQRWVQLTSDDHDSEPGANGDRTS